MSEIDGTITVTGYIAPPDSKDVFPTHVPHYGKGSHRGVQSIADRNAIPTERREAGMFVYVIDDGNFYYLEPDLITWTLFTASAAANLVIYATAFEDLDEGDLTAFYADSGILKCRLAYAGDDSGGANAYPAEAFVLEDWSAGEVATNFIIGQNNKKTGLTPNTQYYLSDSTPKGKVRVGKLNDTDPLNDGKVSQYIGKGVSTVTLFVNIGESTIIEV